jgi:hypothetical protein
MGRSFESIRMGIKDVSARWLKASKALKKEILRLRVPLLLILNKYFYYFFLR